MEMEAPNNLMIEDPPEAGTPLPELIQGTVIVTESTISVLNDTELETSTVSLDNIEGLNVEEANAFFHLGIMFIVGFFFFWVVKLCFKIFHVFW